MAVFGFLLRSGPYESENSNVLYHIADAALDRGHEIYIFKYLEGVFNPLKYQRFSDLRDLPKDKFSKLVQRGAEIVACGVCVNARGLENGRDYIEKVKVGGLPDFAESVGKLDKLIVL